METAEFARYGDESLRLDLRRAAAPIAPVVVYLHGGAWVVGKRADHPERLDGLAAAGVTVVSIDYRLVTEAPFPAQRVDVETAVEWLVDARVVSDASQIVLMGASAGAHLGALTALTSHYRFAGFVGLFGRYDLSSAADDIRPTSGHPIPEEILANVLPAGFETVGARLAALAGVKESELTDEILLQLSPVAHLSPTAPPLLLMHGRADALVHHDHALAFAARAEQLGVHCNVELLPDANHEDPSFGAPFYLSKIARFVESVVENPRAGESK